MAYLRKKGKYILAILLVVLAFNLYFLLLLHSARYPFIFYLDILLLTGLSVFIIYDVHKFQKEGRIRKRYLEREGLISTECEDFENREIALHDIEVLQAELSEQFGRNCDLQDYITKWCHEVKIPLSAGLLMAQKIPDPVLRLSMQSQLEKINLQLHSALLGAKVESSLLDINLQPVRLLDCVQTAIKNNRFFLIHEHFELDIRVGNEEVYSDKAWLVYILDQLIGNAVKYRAERSPRLQFLASPAKAGIRLVVEDNGEGIRQSDIRRIYERGFTGSNHHNGQYRSTGMGLYMVSMILKKLGHEITAESEFGSYTRFTLTFTDNREFFQLS